MEYDLDCGCEFVHTQYDEYDSDYYMNYCPMHEAVQDLFNALENVLHVHSMPYRGVPTPDCDECWTATELLAKITFKELK